MVVVCLSTAWLMFGEQKFECGDLSSHPFTSSEWNK